MDELAKVTVSDRLASQYGIRVFRPGGWPPDDLERVLKAVEDLATLMGGSTRFQSELRRARICRLRRETRFAAVSLPVVGVVYFESASWADEWELKWQTVHELAHIWDMRKLLRLSNGLKRATGSKYGRFARRLPIPFVYEPGGKWLPGRSAPLNALEDWADSVASYAYSDYAESIPESLGGPRLISPVRWNYVGRHMEVRLTYPIGWDLRFERPEGLGPGPV